MKELITNNGHKLFVDDEDFERLSTFSYTRHQTGTDRTTVAGYSKTYISIANDALQIYNVLIDHKDRNPDNNQKENLRVATRSQNNCNRPGWSLSGYKGVDYYKRTHKYRARIQSNGKLLYIGIFKTQEEAARAYDIKAKELHGEFAVLNFP